MINPLLRTPHWNIHRVSVLSIIGSFVDYRYELVRLRGSLPLAILVVNDPAYLAQQSHHQVISVSSRPPGWRDHVTTPALHHEPESFIGSPRAHVVRAQLQLDAAAAPAAEEEFDQRAQRLAAVTGSAHLRRKDDILDVHHRVSPGKTEPEETDRASTVGPLADQRIRPRVRHLLLNLADGNREMRTVSRDRLVRVEQRGHELGIRTLGGTHHDPIGLDEHGGIVSLKYGDGRLRAATVAATTAAPRLQPQSLRVKPNRLAISPAL
ncbi:hypothetical protein Ae406Ps2_5960c [Pseudonocardia sp. Ae406_Ps2]|nr:hypothetical protein Ae406Ps2_5960c [Pseudonocardia sp. Ae406_Ps2]